ncbi:pectin lyase fold/virulence factor [Mucor mucedo]|uniref:pectin lyase fold/virulence factor n=1 Tax=Mucor mucedo TaxID=29922 RepID=UPI002220E78E|nr:pectin lyase fold/virulence factor [Mucor mucedo]KAI7887738.1 pectin lyase fold/virulence factor [Mucor mucedo]
MVQFLSFGLSLIASLVLASSVTAGPTCVVAKSSSDDSITIAKAFNDCKNGGTVNFPKGTTYNMKSVLNIQGLKGVTVNFQGQINLPPFNKSFKGGNAYISIKGDHINFSGGGTIVGNGQTWWDIKDTTAPTVLRIGATNSDFGHFNILNSPRAHMGMTGSKNVVLHDVYLKTVSANSNLPKNTDALDVSSSSDIIFKDSNLFVGDDCTAINGGVTNMTISNVHCTGGHGFSVGSLGKGGATEYVKDVTVVNSICTNCQNGLRIKTWSGGKGSVQNVKFNNVQLINTDNPIIVTTHYCDKNQMSYCQKSDGSSLSISGVTVSGISGSASSAGKPIVNINCSSGSHCSNFSISGVTVKKAAKTPKNICTYLDNSGKIGVCSQ